MVDNIPNFKKQEKVGLSISVDKENLEKMRNFMKDFFPNLPLSIPFDNWLDDFINNLPNIKEAIKKKRATEEQSKKEEDEVGK